MKWSVPILQSTLDGDVSLTHSTIVGDKGVRAMRGSLLIGQFSHVTSSGTGLQSTEMAELNWFEGDVSGSIVADFKSLLLLQDVDQTANPLNNVVNRSSTLTINDTTLVGPTHLRIFSNGEVINGSGLGVLTCSTGSDIFCDGTETKTSSTCGLCP